MSNPITYEESVDREFGSRRLVPGEKKPVWVEKNHTPHEYHVGDIVEFNVGDYHLTDGEVTEVLKDGCIIHFTTWLPIDDDPQERTMKFLFEDIFPYSEWKTEKERRRN